MQNRSPYTKKGKKKARRKQLTTILVMVVLVVGMMVAALALSGKGKAPVEPVSSAPSVPSSVPQPVSQPEPEPKMEVPPATGPFDHEGLPLLLNFENPVPADYQLNLVSVGNDQKMDAEAAAAFSEMQKAAKADGITLTPLSGYRSHERQTNNYNNSIQSYVNQGKSKEEAERLTRRYYAIPGTSEHEAGLAVDINQIDDSFDQTAAFNWLQEHCNDYGFIFRYRKEAEPITQIAYEPWHYRFVGANHAKEITARGITLEEYIALFQE